MALHKVSAHRIVAILILFIATRVHAESGHYRIDVAPDLSRFDVSACFDVPARLIRPADSGGRLIGKLRVDGIDPAGAIKRDRVLLDQPGSCLRYEVDVPAAARLLRYSEVGRAGRDYVLLDPDRWLLLPQAPFDAPLQISFGLPAGMAVSAPWPQAADSNSEFLIDLAGYRREWPSLLAVGRMSLRVIDVPGAKLRLAILPATGRMDSDWVQEWIRQGAMAVAGAYGRFPIPAPQVLVVPVGPGREPVPWGQVLRGGGAGAHMFIDETRGVEEFRRDWVLVHELSHLLHPKFDDDGVWLAEGLASWYQNVLRARSGVLSETEAWKKLRDGFLRGVDQTRDGETLVDASRAMHETHRYMRVYWSGAALVMAADVTLRGQGQSLDAALAGFQACCLAQPRMWSTIESLAQLDRLTKSSVFTDLYRRHAHSDAFPDIWPLLEQMGVCAEGESVTLDDAAPAAEIRRDIMRHN